MGQTRLKLGRGEGGQPRKHAHMPSYTKLHAQYQLPSTLKKSAWIILLFKLIVSMINECINECIVYLFN